MNESDKSDPETSPDENDAGDVVPSAPVAISHPTAPATQLKWGDRPWYATLGAISLVVGGVLTIANIVLAIAKMNSDELVHVLNLPNMVSYYIDIDESAYVFEETRKSEITNCPWLTTGIPEESMEGGPGFSSSLPGDFPHNQVSVQVLKLENQGGSGAFDIVIECDEYSFEQIREVELNSNQFLASNGNVTPGLRILNVRVLQTGSGLVVPLFIQALDSDPDESRRGVFGRVLFPKKLRYRDAVGNTHEISIPQQLTTPLRLTPHMRGRG